MGTLKLRLLGPVDIHLGGKSLSNFPTRVSIALLILLVEDGVGVQHSREVLAERLFPGLSIESSRKNFRQALYSLRQIIPEVQSENREMVPFVISTRHNVYINEQIMVQLDTTGLMQCLQQNTREALQQAVDLYRGDFLSEFFLTDNAYFEEWTQRRRQHYREHFMSCLQRLNQLCLADEDLGAAKAFAKKLFELDPLRERSARILLRTLAVLGERSEAIRLYEGFKQSLDVELGLLPESTTSSIYEAIIHGKQVEIRDAVPDPSPEIQTNPAVVKATPIVQLPVRQTLFFGREVEIANIQRICQDKDVHILTLLGIGGVGKTRLAIRATEDLSADFPAGIYFIPLISVKTNDELTEAVTKVLGLKFSDIGESTLERMASELGDSRFLCIFDNFNHLVSGGGSQWISTFSQMVPNAMFVITSSRRLNLVEEHVYQVRGLSLPLSRNLAEDEDLNEFVSKSGAIQLFIDRAEKVNPKFKLTRENIKDVIDICLMVNGLPLGVELAAAWMEMLPPGDVASEIHNTLSFLSSDLLDIDERHRSLQAVFASSWKLIGAKRQAALTRLSIFPGSFSLEAALKISRIDAKSLQALVQQAWLQQVGDGALRMHPLLQYYAHKQLMQDSAKFALAEARYIEFYAGLCEQQKILLHGPAQQQAFETIQDHLENIQSVFRLLVGHRLRKAAQTRLLPTLFFFYESRLNYSNELAALVHTGMHPDQISTNLQTPEIVMRSVAAWFQIRMETSDMRTIQKLRILWKFVKENALEDEMGGWYALLAGTIGLANIDTQASIQALEELLPKLESGDEPWWYGFAIFLLTRLTFIDGRSEAAEWAEKAYAHFALEGGHLEQADTMLILAEIKANNGEYLDAWNLLEGVQKRYEIIGCPVHMASLKALDRYIDGLNILPREPSSPDNG